MIQLPENSRSPSLMPDMTALLDVIFILLVFMMLTANAAPRLLQLDLPQAAAPSESVEPDAITLGISETGQFSIDRTTYPDWAQFQQALTGRIEKARLVGELPQLLVAADKDVALQPFVKLAGWLSEQGLFVAEVVVSDRNEM
ncbi:ExbD/TolR family protein [Porticoccus sp.]